MADLDAELLALAGDSSDEEPTSIARAVSPDTPSNSNAPVTKARARKPAKGKSGAKRGARRDESEDRDA